MDRRKYGKDKTMKGQKLRGKFTAYYYEYPEGQGAYGSGGWSRYAKRKPAPLLIAEAPSTIELRGKSVYLDGKRKLKVTIVRNSTGEVMREDYELSRIKKDTLPNPLRLTA